MSQLLLTTGKEVASNPQRQAIIRSRQNGFFQWANSVSASTKNILPGGTTNIKVNFNSPFWEHENAHYIVYDVHNKHATDSITFKNGPFNHWKEMIVRPNGSNVPIEFKNIATIREIVGESYLNSGLSVYEDSSFVRDELTTADGVTVGPLSSKTFYFPLDQLISFMGTSVKDEIKYLDIDLTATEEQSNAQSAGRLFQSSTNVNLWTQANIELKNIRYMRNFVEVRNPALAVSYFKSLDPKIPIRNSTWRVYEKVLTTGAWNKSSNNTFSTKLSDIYKSDKIQHVSFVSRPITSTFNSVETVKEYSGHEFIGYKVRTLNLGSNDKELDMTDKRILRDYELKQYRNEYGRKQLPLELLTDGSNQFTKYFTRMTRLNFDFMQVENNHEVVRFTNSNVDDFDIELFANGTAGANNELVAYVVVADETEFERTGPNMGQLKKV